jgi:hypothetical protein
MPDADAWLRAGWNRPVGKHLWVGGRTGLPACCRRWRPPCSAWITREAPPAASPRTQRTGMLPRPVGRRLAESGHAQSEASLPRPGNLHDRGGADVGSFPTTLNVPSPGFVWNNADADLIVSTSAGVDIRWSSGSMSDLALGGTISSDQFPNGRNSASAGTELIRTGTTLSNLVLKWISNRRFVQIIVTATLRVHAKISSQIGCDGVVPSR